MERKWALLQQILSFRKAALELSAAVHAYRERESEGNYLALVDAHERFKKVI